MLLNLQRFCLLGIGLLAGCMDVSSPSGADQPVRAAADDPELCGEHGVLESVCTQCNQSLIPVFQASGDWCDAHGFPESFCPICAPEQGGRPGIQPTAADGAPADGTLVRFRTRSAAKMAGLAVVRAEETDWVEGTEAVARITWDATRVAAVSARAPGVVSGIRAEVGDSVERAQVLAEVRSAHVAGDRSRLIAATQARDVATAEVERQRTLLAGGVSSQRELLAAEQALSSAEAVLAAVAAEVALVGAGSGDRTLLTTPISGTVIARHVRVGQAVDGLQPLFEVVDPRTMWAELDISERDLVGVALGQEVRIHLDALPDVRLTGQISAISPMVTPETRTVLARVELDNAAGLLRANLYGTATILGASSAAAVVVPDAAIQRAGTATLVFVQQQVDTFVARRVRVLARQGERVRIVGGIAAGDPVVTTGSFLLKTETLKDSIGAGCCDVE